MDNTQVTWTQKPRTLHHSWLTWWGVFVSFDFLLKGHSYDYGSQR